MIIQSRLLFLVLIRAKLVRINTFCTKVVQVGGVHYEVVLISTSKTHYYTSFMQEKKASLRYDALAHFLLELLE